MPTERELAQRFGTSRTTVRQAIAELVVDGRLERMQGRGTFVARPKLMQVRQLTSFSQDLQTQGRRPGSVVLRIDERPADDEVSAHLEIAPGTPIHRVERLRTAAEEPIAHEIAHLVGPLPDLAGQLAARGSLYRTLQEAFAVELAVVEDVVETALADPVEASLLGVDTGLPMLLVHRTAWDAERPAGGVDSIGVPRGPVPIRRPARARFAHARRRRTLTRDLPTRDLQCRKRLARRARRASASSPRSRTPAPAPS